MPRPRFSSRLSSLLTIIGVSVGLGNVWRFPYMMGKFGGSAFLFIYLIFTFLFAIPALSAELALGRETRQGPIGAFKKAFGHSGGLVIGYLLLLVVLVADSYYLVVIANVFDAAWFSLTSGFSEANNPVFHDQLSNGWIQFLISGGLLLVSLWIIHKGLRNGIEVISQWVIPFFLIVILVLIGYVFTLPGTMEKTIEFLNPDFGAINASVVFAALGQAFFSLGLGGTFLLMYGSYLDEKQSILNSATTTALGDCGASLLSSLFIIPVILVFGLDMTSGPNLIFITLPQLFAQMPWGRAVGTSFLLALMLVAFLSNIAALEVLVNGTGDDERVKLSKNQMIVVVGVLELLLISLSAFHPNLIGYLDLIFGSGMQTLGSVITVVGLTWGLGRITADRQLSLYGEGGTWFFNWLKWVIPGVLTLILISYLYSLFN